MGWFGYDEQQRAGWKAIPKMKISSVQAAIRLLKTGCYSGSDELFGAIMSYLL